MVGARHGHDMASVNQTRPNCVNGKDNSYEYNDAQNHKHKIGKDNLKP